MKGTPTARDIMKTDLVVFHPTMPLIDAVKKLIEHQIAGAPVVDDDYHLLGFLSEKDCLMPLVEMAVESDPVTQVVNFMNPTVRTITEDTDVLVIAELFMKSPIRRLPVVKDGKLVGLVARHDFLKGMLEWTDPTSETKPQARNYWSRIHGKDESPLA